MKQKTVIWRPHPGKQELALTFGDNIFELLYGGARGGGKAQPLDSLILGKDKWLKMGDIKIDDEIYAQNGSIQRVVGIFPQGVKKVYKVRFIDGSSCETTEDHLWKVHFTCTKRKNGVFTLK